MKLEKTVARYLISTPCRVVGEFSTDDIAIDHAWPRDPGSSSRRFYVVSVRHEEHTPAAGVVLPSYRINAELIAALASVWFGKRFDVHGPLQEHGHFSVPSLWTIQPIADPEATPFSPEPRKDLNIALSWSTFDRPFELFLRYPDGTSGISAFWRATRFYARALRALDNDPEVAFIHLVTGIEILAGRTKFEDDQKFDDTLRRMLTQIRQELADGERVENEIRSRLRQLTRKFSHCAVKFTNDNFFKGSEATHPAGRLLKEDLVDRMKSTYSLRSKYVHAGADIGGWLHSSSAFTQDIQMGRPLMEDQELARLIQKALTLAGLERLVRFMTLRFGHLKIFRVHDALE